MWILIAGGTHTSNPTNKSRYMHKEPEVVVVKGLPSFTLDESRYIKKKRKTIFCAFSSTKGILDLHELFDTIKRIIC
jgi:hypothetical protein